MYFEKNKFIGKSFARQYEKDLKRELKSWADEKHLEKVKGILPKDSLHSVFSVFDMLGLFAIAMINNINFNADQSPLNPSL